MATPKTLWNYSENGQKVTIWNQGPVSYGIEIWESLKAQHGYSDQELAEVLNNFKP